MNHRQLTFAREYRGYSQTELAKSIDGLSQSNLSKFEKGFDVLSDEIKDKIIEFLDFPKEFFEKKINISIDNANYRKKATINKTLIQQFENKSILIGDIIDEFSETVEWPEFKLAPMNTDDGFTIKYIANYTRKLLRLSNGESIKDIISLLESHGIIIYEIDAYEKFDAVSFITFKGFPTIILNKNFSNDRKRFTIAHELGHILLHNHFPISSYRDKEAEANEFASEFLMPEDEIKNSLYYLKLNDLSSLKVMWLTSMSSIIRRAKTLNCIDDNRYKFLMIEMSRNGYTKKEPIDVYIDKTTCFQNAYKLFKDELSYTIEDFIKYTKLPKDILTDIFSFETKVRLKVLRPN